MKSNDVQVAPEPARNALTTVKKWPNLRWWITALLFFSTVINYMDRQNLSILARTIQDDLHITDIQYGYVVQCFLLAYTVSYLFAGRLTDKLGTRASMACFIVWWSLSDMLTSFSRSVVSLGFFRFLLGMGEPGNYTSAPKAVSEWFPPRERGLVIGIYTAGATLGATIAPPVIAYLSAHFHWRSVFLFTGSLGLLWVIPWLWLYRKPEEHPRLSDEERRLITGDAGSVEFDAMPAEGLWRHILRRKETWLLMVSRMITDPVWYFYLFWFPKYLTDARHLTLAEVGRIAWLVYLAADIGCIAGGYLSGLLIKRGMAPARSRIWVMAGAAFLLPLSPLINSASSPLMAVGIAAIAAFAHLAWQISIGALIVDIYPKPVVGTVFGLVAAGSGLGGMLSTNLVGRAVTYWSYSPVFIVMGVLHPLAFLLVRGIRARQAARLA
ncbi:MFS transporter [uncultured Paludibaculum sp.]|uniref:MFS transporter n=1 Tax=uncultured Paludibaculum sp. TaxID=1765020 RepID=UPI002AAAC990|nr:MFS transporter [uncultured Paludibaculum sp.]